MSSTARSSSPSRWAASCGHLVWTARSPLAASPWRTPGQTRGSAPRETRQIETATLIESPSWAVGGRRYAIEEHGFNPIRALVTVGTRVRFVNNGEIAHTVAARDGSWTTGALEPATWEFVTFDEPGTLLYHCTDHLWAIGEITVEP